MAQNNSFSMSALWYRIKLILSGTGLGIFPLVLLVFGIIAFTSLFLFFAFFKNAVVGLIAFLAVLYFVYNVVIKINNGILQLAQKKNSLPLFLPEKNIVAVAGMIYGDKRKGVKELREIKDEKMYTLEPPKGDVVAVLETNEKGAIVAKKL